MKPELTAMILVFSRLPGTGKTTLAEYAARRLQAPVFSIDVLEAALRRSAIGAGEGSHHAAYELLSTLAEGQLRLGQSACIDAVMGLESTREAWRALTNQYDATLKCIECVCSDRKIHRDRIESRQRGIPGWYELLWSDVERSMASFQAWRRERLILDAAVPLEGNLGDLDTYLFGSSVVNFKPHV